MYFPQISLLCRPSPSPPLLHHHRHKPFLCHCRSSSLSLFLLKPQRCRRHLHLRLRLCAFSSPNSNPSPDLAKDPIFDSNHPQSPDLSQRTYPFVAEEEQPAVEAVESGPERKSRLPLVVFLVGILESVRRGFDRLATSEWLSWWPFWQQEKRLERLIAEADANPKDAVKQGALLAELNKHSPESVIRRFEQRNNAVDSKGVAEYLRALVVTNALAEYLPDEHLGKPSSLPTLNVKTFKDVKGCDDAKQELGK